MTFEEIIDYLNKEKEKYMKISQALLERKISIDNYISKISENLKILEALHK